MSPARRRASKACDNCRARRVKCGGGMPCIACRDADLAERCVIRVKARPKRPASSKLSVDGLYPLSDSSSNLRAQPLSPCNPYHNVDDDNIPNIPSEYNAPFNETTLQDLLSQSDEDLLSHSGPSLISALPSIDESAQNPAGVTTNTLNPLADIEGALLFWSFEKGVSLDSLCYKDEDRMTSLHATPLPPLPYLVEFENALIRSLAYGTTTDEDWDPLGEYDQTRVLLLYGRYRVLPNSLTDDQKGLVYASLCVAKHIQMKRYVRSGTPGPESSSREDLTYYHMACDALASWNRPSIHAMWALFCLAPCCQAHGGVNENRKLLEQMAWQVKELGLNKAITAQLYPPQDMVQILMSTFHYQDTMVAGLTNLRLCMPLTDIDVDCTMSGVKTPEALYRASCHAAAYLQAHMDTSIDTTSDEFMEAAESQWTPALSDVRNSKITSRTIASLSWAQIRYHWLRILIYYPRTKLSPARSSHAWSMLSRAVAHIIQIHAELHKVSQLNPSWPQVKRFAHVGQVLILCCIHGEIHRLEGQALFELLLKLLLGHVPFFECARKMVEGYTQAAKALGYTLSEASFSAPTFDIQPLDIPIDDPGWGLLGVFDPLLLFNIGAEGSIS